jgi:DNA-binding NtrC family response regulator
MRILVIEDDDHKLKAIRSCLALVDGADITVATSLRTAMVELEERSFDFVVLDMAIPSHTSDVGAVDTYSQPVGGLDVLLFLASANRPERVAILTQHPTVEYDRRHVPLKNIVAKLLGDGIGNVAAAIWFSDSNDWKAPLLATIGDLT